MQCTTQQHNIITINCTLSVGRQGDRNELLEQVAKRAERAQLLVTVILTIQRLPGFYMEHLTIVNYNSISCM